jgi:hypothetical protein
MVKFWLVHNCNRRKCIGKGWCKRIHLVSKAINVVTGQDERELKIRTLITASEW